MVARDLLQDLGCRRVDRDLIGNDPGHFFLALAVDQDGDKLVVGVEGSLNHPVALGDKDPLHVSPALTPHAQGVIA